MSTATGSSSVPPSDPGHSVVVRVEPLGVDVPVQPGETLMHAAEGLGLAWPTLCHGHAQCTVCYIVVDEDPGAFAAPEVVELKGLELFSGRSFYQDRTLRLACQARPVASTTVTKRGVRPRPARHDERISPS